MAAAAAATGSGASCLTAPQPSTLDRDMKVRLTRDGEQKNPDFDRHSPRVRGKNWPTRVVAAGTEIEHPDAWLLCLPTHFEADPIAEPVDEEATMKVQRAIERRTRHLADRGRQAKQVAGRRARKTKKHSSV